MEEKFLEEEFQDCFLYDINFNPSNKKLEVFVDCDAALTLAKCSRLNRYLQGHIDEEDWLGEKYILDVSSPGTSKPLKFKRQYVKNIGRKVEVKLLEPGKVEGKLKEVLENSIKVFYKTKVKVGKKKVIKEILEEVPFDKIKETKVKISFNKT